MKNFAHFVQLQEFKQELEDTFLLKEDILTDEQSDSIAGLISTLELHDEGDVETLQKLNIEIYNALKKCGVSDNDFNEFKTVYAAEGYDNSKTNLLLMKAREIAQQKRQEESDNKGT